ncbi:MAG: TonB-dependent receptor [candidate division KSB1 bacterium]|nr:TonB-dependent receptor [candidate division KSB1 bacterium]
MLDRQRPDWYRNRHTSKSYGFSLPVHVQAPGGLATVKLQGRAELVTSSSLGDHIRQTYGASLSYRVQWSEQLSFTSSTFSHYYDQWGWQVWPGLSAAYRLTPHARIFASWGRAFRMPSFTELYYASPGNIGNPDLDASASSTLELGTRMYAENRMLQVSLFRRTGANIIDWVRAQPQDPWMVINHSKTRFTGLEWEARLNEPVLSLTVLSLRGIHLYANKTLFGFESKYALRYLRHHIRLYTDVAFRRNMHAGMAVHWKQPDYDNGYMLMNLQLYRTLGSWRLALSAENVTDTHYRDLPGVPTPGRWMRFNVSKYW